MKKENKKSTDNGHTNKGYNEKTPAEPEGAFPPASSKEKPVEKPASNAADKKEKEDEN